ncbi:MAG TPA: hypothetical protein VLF43_00815 [Candidatus Saccharimonadales bacterium]|nr:hypothetical protein [Candidatus Saccharimonadales bacterium]
MTDMLERTTAPVEATSQPGLTVLSLDMPPADLMAEIKGLEKPVAQDVRNMLIGAAVTRHTAAIEQHQATGQPVAVPEAVISPVLHGSEGQSVLAFKRKEAGLRTAGHPAVPGMRLLVSL